VQSALPESVQRMNAANNLLTLIVNLVAALAYTMVAFHRIDWAVGFPGMRCVPRSSRPA
jgi:hypothetical protein